MFQPFMIWLMVFPVSLIAGLLSWKVGEQYLDYYKPSKAALMQQQNFTPLNNELRIFVPRNTAIAYGAMGAILGLSLGLVGGLARRSVLFGVAGMVAGCLVGGAGATLASFALVPIFRQNYTPDEPSLFLPLLTRGGIWMAAGAGAGLGFGLGLRAGWTRTIRALFGGALGGLLGTLVFESVQAFLFPLALATELLSESKTLRFLSYLIAAICVAVMAVFCTGLSAPPTKSTPEIPPLGD